MINTLTLTNNINIILYKYKYSIILIYVSWLNFFKAKFSEISKIFVAKVPKHSCYSCIVVNSCLA